MTDLTVYRNAAGNLEGEKADALAILKELDLFLIEGEEDSNLAAEIIRDVKARWKHLEDHRKSVVKPLNDAAKTVNGWFKPTMEALEKTEYVLKSKIAAYVELQAVNARKAIEAARQAETAEEATKALAAAPAIVAPPQGVSMRKVWKWVIEEESQVPRILCSPDQRKIDAELRGQVADGKEPQIPGLRCYQESVLAVRG